MQSEELEAALTRINALEREIRELEHQKAQPEDTPASLVEEELRTIARSVAGMMVDDRINTIQILESYGVISTEKSDLNYHFGFRADFEPDHNELTGAVFEKLQELQGLN